MGPARTIAFPAEGIAYIGGYYAAVRRAGIEVIDGVFSGVWLWEHLRRGDVCHFHWPSFSYSGGRSTLRVVFRFARFLALLALIRLRGGRLAWTAHNLMPHDRCPLPWLDRLGRHAMIALSERVAVHGPAAAQVLIDAFPQVAGKMVTIVHGHFADLYPNRISRAQARSACGIPAPGPVILFLGLCKPYKNVDGLVDTFRSSSIDATLLIAGRFPDAEYLALCRRLAANDVRIRIVEGFIADDDMQNFLNAADVLVAPYRDILTSGSAVLAASYGLPFVSVAKGFMLDFVSRDTGVLYPPASEDGLLAALNQALARQWDRDAIVAHARTHRFDDAVAAFYGSLAAARAASR